MRKIVVLVLAIASFTQANAQGSDWIKLGIHAGLPIGDVTDSHALVLGLDLKYQFLNTNSYAVGISTGYTNYFGEDEIEDIGIIPIAGLFRYYPTKNFFLGADLGYGFARSGDEDDNGFYYRPEIGYHDNNWNIYGFYQGISLNELNPSSIGIGISFNIVRGS
ncbi:hypothetical protein [Lacinutrix jangbogonensis]|uniref:hypothetical protein n=1 Tax=Lacinutrix jangbogonensis TaxID=1469557 RepID=UPI00053E6E68|nr:hypothetical protein [Lacinutrix jangbogonensis]